MPSSSGSVVTGAGPTPPPGCGSRPPPAAPPPPPRRGAGSRSAPAPTRRPWPGPSRDNLEVSRRLEVTGWEVGGQAEAESCNTDILYSDLKALKNSKVLKVISIVRGIKKQDTGFLILTKVGPRKWLHSLSLSLYINNLCKSNIFSFPSSLTVLDVLYPLRSALFKKPQN